MHRLGDREHRVLARVVGAEVADRAERGNRRGIHDVTHILGDEYRHEESTAVDHAPEIDAEHPLPRRERLVPCREPAATNARVVAHDVIRAEAFERSGTQRFDRRGIGDVGGHREHLGALVA